MFLTPGNYFELKVGIRLYFPNKMVKRKANHAFCTVPSTFQVVINLMITES